MFLNASLASRWLLLCLALLSSTPLFASQQSSFKNAVADIVNSSQMVGLAVAVVRDDQVSWMQTYGVRENGGHDRIAADTRFRVASLSKAFAAAVALQLENENKLSLDDLAVSSNQDFRLKSQAQTQSVTIRHVLSHRLSLPPYAYDNLLEADIAPQKILGEMNKVEPICKVGTCYAYQNVGFNMIAPVIEVTDKQTYASSVRSRLLEPLGMASASFGKKSLMRNSNWARSYKRKRGADWQAVSVKQPYYDVPAAGGLNASIHDMAKWLAAQLGNAPEVLSNALLTQMHARQVKTPSELRRMKAMGRLSDAHYGLGWRVYNYAGARVVNHSGSVEGYAAQIAFLPERNVGIVLLTNSNAKQFWRILPTFLDHELGLQGY